MSQQLPRPCLCWGFLPTLPFPALAAYKRLSWWKENGCLVLETAFYGLVLGLHLRPICDADFGLLCRLGFYAIGGLSRPINWVFVGDQVLSPSSSLLSWCGVFTFGFVFSIICFVFVCFPLCLKQKWEALCLYHFKVCCVIYWLIDQLINQWQERKRFYCNNLVYACIRVLREMAPYRVFELLYYLAVRILSKVKKMGEGPLCATF